MRKVPGLKSKKQLKRTYIIVHMKWVRFETLVVSEESDVLNQYIIILWHVLPRMKVDAIGAIHCTTIVYLLCIYEISVRARLTDDSGIFHSYTFSSVDIDTNITIICHKDIVKLDVFAKMNENALAIVAI